MSAQVIFNWINTWSTGDNPGAGDQYKDSTGINGNWFKIGEKMFFLFALPSTSLRSGIIGPAQLTTDVADGTTLTQDISTGQLSIKDHGVNTTQLATQAVGPDQLGDDAFGAGITRQGNGAMQVNTDNITVEIYNNQLRVKPGGLPGATIADDSIPTSKLMSGKKLRHCFTFSLLGSETFARTGGMLTGQNLGVPMPENGTVTGISAICGNGRQFIGKTVDPADFLQGDRITFYYLAFMGSYTLSFMKNGSIVGQAINYGYGTEDIVSAFITLEVEFD